MTVKLACFILIICCGTAGGMELRQRLATRVKSLEMFCDLLRDFSATVAHTGSSWRELARDYAARKGETPFLRALLDSLTQEGFLASWKKSVLSVQKSLSLTDADAAVLLTAADAFGCPDRDGVLEALDLTRARLAAAVAEAREKRDTDGKIFVTLGVSCGIILGLLVI